MSDPQLSPDGMSVVYSVTRVDRAQNRRITSLDPRVPHALRHFGRTAELVIFPRANHNVVPPDRR